MIIKEKEIKISQTYRADSAPQEPKSALRGRMQRLGLNLLACTLAIGATGSASAGEARDEAAVRALGDSFAKAFVQKDAELRASLFAEDGTFVTPVGDFLQGQVAMVSRKSQETIGPNVDIPATTEFEEVAFLGIDGKLLLTL